MPVKALILSNKCSQILRTPGVQINNIEGRTTGANISFTEFTYSDYTMRRKAEVLKHKDKDNITNKSTYSYLSQNGYYSKSKLIQFINNRTVDCNASSSSSCSGVIGSTTTYYLNASVPYFPSI
jgi:hypothetical protein